MKRWGEIWLLLVGFLALLALAGCADSGEQPTALAAQVVSTRTQPTALPTLQPTALPPVIVTPTASSAEPEAVSAEKLAPTAAPTLSPTPIATATPVPEISPTPQPTFTPPPPATSSADAYDHYWLNRPIAEGSALWTDKTYPYASTRGGTLRPHHGVEFYVPSGTPVFATAAGTVRVAGTDSAFAVGPEPNFYGNVIIIEHDFLHNGQAVFTLYGHLSAFYVVEGQRVEAQELIALSGATGVADGPHLHLEVRIGANDYRATRNPSLWLFPFYEYGTVAGRVTWPDGTLAVEAPISIARIDAPSPWRGGTTYAVGDVNPDDAWQENFVLDDVQAGFYRFTVSSGESKVEEEVWVYPGQTTFLEMTLSATASP